MWGNFWIARDHRLVVDEMESYIKRYRVNNFVFNDLSAVLTKDAVVHLCQEMINRKLNITWQLLTLRTEALDRSVLALMRQAGCQHLDFAIESGSKTILNSIGKRNNPKKMISLVKESLKVDINITANIILGLPGESWREFFQTYRLILKLAIVGTQELNVFPFMPYPGSKLFYSFLKDKKIKLNDEYFSNLFGYTDLIILVSWSDHFGPRTLAYMKWFLLINFYGLTFILHPQRLIKLMINLGRGTPSTKLEGVLDRIFKTVKIYFKHEKK